MVLLFYIVWCLQLLFCFEGKGLKYGLHNRAEKCNHRMSQGKKTAPHKQYFYRVSNAL